MKQWAVLLFSFLLFCIVFIFYINVCYLYNKGKYVKYIYYATIHYSAPGKTVHQGNKIPGKSTRGLNLHCDPSSKNSSPGELPQGNSKQELLGVTQMVTRRVQCLRALSPPALLHQGAEVLPLQEPAVLLQLPLPQHQDLVGALNRLQPVSDHQHRAVPAGPPVLQLNGEDHNLRKIRKGWAPHPRWAPSLVAEGQDCRK